MRRRSSVEEGCTYDVVSDEEFPEGGWGWIAAFGLALMFITALSPFAVFGLLFDDLLESLGEGTQTLTFISNLTASVSSLIGVVINYILSKYSCRQVGVAGSIIFFIGSFTSAFANSAVLLAFAYGVLQGIGLGIMIPATLTNFNKYFFRRRTFAMGVAHVITGIGSMLLPIILQKLMQVYGFRGTQLIIAAISLHSLLCAAVQIAPNSHVDRTKADFGKDGNNRKDPLDSGKKGFDRKPQTVASFDLRAKAVNRTTETSRQSESSETLGGMQPNSFLQRGENISRQHFKGEIPNVDSNARSDYVINTNVESCSQKEFQTNENLSQNPSLLREGYTESTKGDISVRNLNEVVDMNSDMNKESQSIVMDHEANYSKYEECNVREDDSEDKRLLGDDHLKVHCFSNRPRTDLASTTTDHPIYISDSKATVTSPRSETSSSKTTSTNDGTLVTTIVDNNKEPNVFSRAWCAVVDFLDLRLLLDPVYVNIVIGNGISFFADITYCALFPLVILKMGYSRTDSIICISILAAADIFGRLSVALIGAFSPQVSSRALLMVGAVTSVAGRTIFVSYEDFTTMAIVSGYLGFTRSFIHVPLPLVVAEYSVTRFPAAYGLSMVVGGVIGLSAGSLVGWVRDTTNSYPICINTLNTMQVVLCIVPWSLEYVFCHLRASSRTNQKSSLEMKPVSKCRQ